ncbi:MAG: TIGR03986 family CRISPR-associated RAMP protein [Bacillota bacterium]
MDTARFINVQMNKKGKIIGSILFANGKTMPVPPEVELSLELDNKECLVTRDKGPITQIVYEGKELMHRVENLSMNQTFNRSTAIPKKRSEYKPNVGSNNINTSDYSAKAPYNFIPLNETLVEGEKTDFSAYHEGRLTGYIQCKLEALTPLYIRDTLDEEEVVKNLESNKHPDFFSPGGKCKIPGSSLRGMVRNLVEIMGWGKFVFFQDKLLFYRGLADQSNLRQEYQDNMSSQDRKTKKASYKFSAGYLKREGLDYYIIPAMIGDNGRQFSQTPKSDYKKEFIFEQYQDNKVLVISGKMQRKKNDWIVNPPDYQKQFKVLDQDIIAYKMDENRYKDKSTDDNEKKRDGDLLRLLNIKGNSLVPCFYVRWNDSEGNSRVSFGHTGYFRLAYKKTIGEHIPSQLKNDEKVDIAETIFGCLSKFASRVYFEDAELIDTFTDVCMPEMIPKILSSPKPTTFQHYLEQPENADLINLNHWNSSCNIRGHKLYWHRRNLEWKEDKPVNEKDTQHTIFKPVKEGTQFTCKIRFENLTEVELGALLFALDLPKNHYHKLGMGKPLGLGTVKITPTLYLSDRKKRYSRLFDGDSWQLAEEISDLGKYIASFERYVLDRINPEERNGADSLWAVERMQHLKAMLDGVSTDNPDWCEETRYMQIGHPQNKNEFKKRPILAKPLEVKNGFEKN